jgi:hypothetical protein
VKQEAVEQRDEADKARDGKHGAVFAAYLGVRRLQKKWKSLVAMWRTIASARIIVDQPPGEAIESLRRATDLRLFPPSHRWSPPGLFLATAHAQGTQFDISYIVLRAHFRAAGTAQPFEGEKSLVSRLGNR